MPCVSADIAEPREQPGIFTALFAGKNIKPLNLFFTGIFCLLWTLSPVYGQRESYDYAEKDPLNSYYVVSGRRGEIARITQDKRITRMTGGGLFFHFQEPVGIQLQFPSSVWVMDRLSRSVFEFDMELNYLTTVTLPDQIGDPGAFLILEDDSWLIADRQSEKIWQLRSGFVSLTSWGMGADLTYIPPDLRMIRYGNRVCLFSAENRSAWITDSQGRVLRRIHIPDSLKARYPAGGYDRILFLSGPSGTWMLAPGAKPEKIDPDACLRIWENTLIRVDGTPEGKGYRPFLPQRVRKP